MSTETDVFEMFVAENSDEELCNSEAFLFFVMLLLIVLKFCDCNEI